MDDDEYTGPVGWPELMVDLRQNNKSLGMVTIRQFLDNGLESGELPETMLIGDATVLWNKLPENVKTGVTAHIRIVGMS
jgi:hypothetical protein